MKNLFLIAGIAVAFAGCNSAPPVQTNTAATKPSSNEKQQTAIAHSSEKQTPPPAAPAANGEKSKWSQSGDPIDTAKFDAAVATAKKTLDGKPTNAAAQKALAEAYYERAVALTDARQYASALGDYRRALKLDPANSDAKEWIDKIIMIYDSIKKSYPAEGEEPPPLPFSKGK
ncbi:MAG: tetratricopeptide repeat protein [Pyrinomonadaceae bacterium]